MRERVWWRYQLVTVEEGKVLAFGRFQRKGFREREGGAYHSRSSPGR